MKYQEPEMLLIRLEAEDVITSSGPTLNPIAPPKDPWVPGDGEIEI